MPSLPAVRPRDLIRSLERLGFERVRQRGSHLRLRAPDGRVTTVPIHGSEPLPKGLLRAIIRDDLELTLEEFHRLWRRHGKG